jgi:hypothetical protein
VSLPALIPSIAALSVPLLYSVTFSGTPAGCMASSKKRLVVVLSRVAVSKKSIQNPDYIRC